MEGFFGAVYEVVKNIPKGKVLSYGDVARLIGSPRASRRVGWALHVNPQPGVIPCHRVLFKDGRLSPAFAFGGMNAQQILLESEGVTVKDGKVDMKIYRWEI